MFVNWNDPRNAPRSPPRYFSAVRCQDGSEIRVPFSCWNPPHYFDARQFIESEPDPTRKEELRVGLEKAMKMIEILAKESSTSVPQG
jgi:hypothetical protein